ncbi:CAP domain-containing protein [Lactobacillus psittaci]|uniref:SCP domain-containing protein n=1 Tax=Lactobacillus psittaci DSM 15354 TaxID=1122152 RepID=A0A0R1S8J6_9LACO|nr:CAP domain-containing protein [Lactobacillus psittaci]KRL62789.1 hypothetical protein FC23_GL001260 [Lactobacillus psittaci DSM 15354]
MKIKHALIGLSASVLLMAPATSLVENTAPTVQAATFSQSEISLIKNLQARYAALDKTSYSRSNLYQITPNLGTPFSAGSLNSNYISSQLAWINYYRALFDLSPISASATENQNAQVAAAVMASINANPFHDQHGLPNESRPSNISSSDWDTAVELTNNSNLNFNVSNESAGDVITDLLTDSYNLTGGDTGHRAWLLSPWLSTTGIGAAYGSNGYRYSVQRVINISDALRIPTKTTLTYPSDGVFPIELLQGPNIYWSLYLAYDQIKGTPTITITDLDTGQKSTATNVSNYNSKYYGNFSTIITYKPGNINLVSGHQYQVNINGVTTYNFKLFNQVAANQPSLNTNKTTTDIDKIKSENLTPEESDVKIKSALLIKAEALRDSLMKHRIINNSVFGRSYQDGKSFHNLGKNQWYHDFYLTGNPSLTAGILNADNKLIDTNIYTSPYASLRTKTNAHLTSHTSYAYGQKIQIGQVNWYYLGPKMWVQKLPTDLKLSKQK